MERAWYIHVCVCMRQNPQKFKSIMHIYFSLSFECVNSTNIYSVSSDVCHDRNNPCPLLASRLGSSWRKDRIGLIYQPFSTLAVSPSDMHMRAHAQTHAQTHTQDRHAGNRGIMFLTMALCLTELILSNILSAGPHSVSLQTTVNG